MIAFLTLIYVGLLFVLVKLGVIRWTPFWKASPVVWIVLLLFVLFIPMQWGAPAGPVTLYQFTIEIIPNVSGQVIEVPVEPMQRVREGEPLFVIDPVPFEADVNDLEASLVLARTRLADAEALARRGATPESRIDRYRSDVDSLEAKLVRARYDLAQTIVRAPADGVVVGLTLRPGQRVANIPLRSWLAFTVDTQIPIVAVPQYVVRHVRVGQEVEVALKSLPGRTLRATVSGIIPSTSQGQLVPSGVLPMINPNPVAEPVAVKLDFDPSDLASIESDLIGGTVGTGAIYTRSSSFTHVIRRVMIRMEAWLNFIVPY